MTTQAKIKEMARTIRIANQDGHLDLNRDRGAIELWLAAAGYTRHQINDLSDDAIEETRAMIKRGERVDAVMAAVGLAACAAAALFAYVGLSGEAMAATAAAGGDSGGLATLITAGAIGAAGWLFLERGRFRKWLR